MFYLIGQFNEELCGILCLVSCVDVIKASFSVIDRGAREARVLVHCMYRRLPHYMCRPRKKLAKDKHSSLLCSDSLDKGNSLCGWYQDRGRSWPGTMSSDRCL